MYISEGKNAHEEFLPFPPRLVPSSIGKLLQRPRSDIPGGLHLVNGQLHFQRWPSIPQKTTARSGRTSGLAKENKKKIRKFHFNMQKTFLPNAFVKKKDVGNASIFHFIGNLKSVSVIETFTENM